MAISQAGTRGASTATVREAAGFLGRCLGGVRKSDNAHEQGLAKAPLLGVVVNGIAALAGVALFGVALGWPLYVEYLGYSAFSAASLQIWSWWCILAGFFLHFDVLWAKCTGRLMVVWGLLTGRKAVSPNNPDSLLWEVRTVCGPHLTRPSTPTQTQNSTDGGYGEPEVFRPKPAPAPAVLAAAEIAAAESLLDSSEKEDS